MNRFSRFPEDDARWHTSGRFLVWRLRRAASERTEDFQSAIVNAYIYEKQISLLDQLWRLKCTDLIKLAADGGLRLTRDEAHDSKSGNRREEIKKKVQKGILVS